MEIQYVLSDRKRFIVPLLLLGLVRPALAQEEGPVYTLTPSIGFYLPTADLVSGQNVEQPLTGQQATVSFGQVAGLALGIKASRSLSAKLALEIELQYTASQIELTGFRTGIGPLEPQKFDARIITVAADALLEIFRSPFTPFAAHLLGGLAVVNRGGDFYDEGGGFFDELDGGTDIAALIGAGFRYGLSPRFGLRLEVRDYISSYTQSVSGRDLDAELQNDLFVTLGLDVTLRASPLPRPAGGRKRPRSSRPLLDHDRADRLAYLHPEVGPSQPSGDLHLIGAEKLYPLIRSRGVHAVGHDEGAVVRDIGPVEVER